MTTKVEKMTITLPKNLISFADEVAAEEKISRSKVVSNCLRELARKRTIELMEEGYKAMAEENKEFAEMAFGLQRKVVLGEK
jgi:metal-responsive CopG/Arc/MetJ family transcriptional regulator